MTVLLSQTLIPQRFRMDSRPKGEHSFRLATMLARSAVLAGEEVLRSVPIGSLNIKAETLSSEALELVRRSRSIVRTAQRELKLSGSRNRQMSAKDAFARFDLDVSVSPAMLLLIERHLVKTGMVHRYDDNGDPLPSFISYAKVRKKLGGKNIDLLTTAAMVNTATRALGYETIVGSYE